jgi:F-type H+/Na+-transporting ATPase subunit beta
MNYYFYENWVAEGHKARIHIAECSFCKVGKGIHPNASVRNGKWHGPYSSYQAVFAAVIETGRHISQCKFCNPKSS